MMKIQKDNQVLTVTKGSYNEFYKDLGFRPVIESKPKFEDSNVIDLPFICKEDKPKNKKKKVK